MRLVSDGQSDRSNTTVPTIADRDSISGSLKPGDLVTVLDASADPNVGSGSAIYVWDGSAFSLVGSGAQQAAQGGSDGSLVMHEQRNLARFGNAAECLQAVVFTYTDVSEVGKVQWTSAEDGNLVWLFSSGQDLDNGIPAEGPVKLGKGETYVFENVPRGAILKSLKGGYGASEIVHDVGGGIIRTAIFPLAPVGMATSEAQIYAARNSVTGGRIYVTNGPLENTVTLRRGGFPVASQDKIPLGPWESVTLFTDADAEFYLEAENPVLVGVRANADAPAYWDHRLVLPADTDGLTWRKSCYISTIDSGTNIVVRSADNATSTFSASPGSPAYLGSSTADYGYHPNSAIRITADGRVQAYTYLDLVGAAATAMSPTRSLSQRVVIPLCVANSSSPSSNSISIASPYTGTARLYKWNQTTGEPELVTVRRNGILTTEIELYRRDSTGAPAADPATPGDQLFPASSGIAPTSAGWEYELLSDFTGGYVEADVPIHVAINSTGNELQTFRGTSGTAVQGIKTAGQELACFGITPPEIEAKFAVDSNGMTRKLGIDAAGAPIWIVC